MLPLSGIRVLELSGLAPAPFCGMVLSDFGADVLRINRTDEITTLDTLARGKKSICMNLKSNRGCGAFKQLCKRSDVLIEPYRPGVMEKFGLGSNVLCAENKRLIYARINGYGHKGSLSMKAGHDINYLAISGVLSKLGRKGENPLPPVNLLGDFGGGGLMAVTGILMALFERSSSGQGQVVDVSITHGTSYLSSFLQRSNDIGIWFGKRGENILDSGAPFYETYMTKDEKYMAVGAIEGKFYQQFLKGLSLEEEFAGMQFSVDKWPDMKEKIAKTFACKTQREWEVVFHDLDACVTPVLDLEDAPNHDHNRDTYMTNDRNLHEPRPAPELSRTPAHKTWRKDPHIGEHTVEVLRSSGFSQEEVDCLIQNKDVVQHEPKSSL